MATNNDQRKLEIFVSTILSEAAEETAKITKQLDSTQSKAIAKVKSNLVSEAQRYEKSKKAAIIARESKRVSTHMYEARRKQLQFREDCASEFYLMAEQHLNDFISSDEYPEHLARLLLRALKWLGRDNEVELALRAEDMHLSEFLQSKAPDVKMSFMEGAFVLGGLRLTCHARAIRVDLSFDSAVSDIIGHFHELSGMSLD